MFAEISCCMLKVWSNKTEPKQLTNRLSITDDVVLLSKVMLNPKEVV